MLARFFILILIAVSLSGCARWDKDKPAATLKFPKGRLAPDSVAFDVAIAQLDNSQAETLENCWSLLDQQKLDLPIRQRLDQNGFRVAIMASHAPAVMNALLQPRPVELEDLDLVEQQLAAKNRMEPKPRVVVHQRISNHDGETYPIQTSEVHPRFDWIVRNGDLQSLGGNERVRGVFEIMTLPQGDGSVRLRVTPRIEHGANRPTFGVAERDFIFDSSQSITRLQELTFDVVLRPGETLVIAPTADVQDLGQLFFGRPKIEEKVDDAIGKNAVALLQPDKDTWPDLVDPAGLPDFAEIELPDLSNLESLDEVAQALGMGNADLIAAKKTPTSHLTHRILMVRIVQTQLDDLFGNSVSQEKLTTAPRR